MAVQQRDAPVVVCADRTRRSVRSSEDLYSSARTFAREAGNAHGLDSNYPRELNALIESESDIHMRQNATYRNLVREHLVGAKLADSRHGVQDWEPYWLRREREDAADERWEVRQAKKRARMRR
jgi:hypothetical protein